jgi:hypothetical protein
LKQDTTKAVIGQHDIYLDAVPVIDPDDLSSFDVSTDQYCRNLKEFTDDVTKETKYLDNLLKNLRCYYKEVKTNWQLLLDVPAGIRCDTIHTCQLCDFQNKKLGGTSDSFDSALPSGLPLLTQLSDPASSTTSNHDSVLETQLLQSPTQTTLHPFTYLLFNVWISHPHLYHLG